MKLPATMIFLFLYSGLTARAEIDNSKKIGSAHHIKVEKIEISPDLWLKDKFNYSVYYGVIDSQGELNRLWSQLINIQKKFYHKFNARIPKPPQVDFNKHIILWFADKGARASFVESLEIKEAEDSNVLNAIVHVFHSDFGSSHLNLWKIPNTDKVIVFKIEHKYETRGP